MTETENPNENRHSQRGRVPCTLTVEDLTHGQRVVTECDDHCDSDTVSVEHCGGAGPFFST